MTLLVLTLALANGVAGSGAVPAGRFLFRGLTPALAVDLTTHDPLVSLVTLAGFALWFPWEWGPGFMAVHGRDAHTGSFWCRLADRFYTPTDSAASRKRYGTVYMTLRGAPLYPLFAALAFLTTPWAAVIGLGCLLQGVCYRLAGLSGEDHAVPRAELLFGAVFGAMLQLAL